MLSPASTQTPPPHPTMRPSLMSQHLWLGDGPGIFQSAAGQHVVPLHSHPAPGRTHLASVTASELV